MNPGAIQILFLKCTLFTIKCETEHKMNFHKKQACRTSTEYLDSMTYYIFKK